MAHAQRLFPAANLDIRDTGTRRYPATGAAPLQSFGDYAAVRTDIQTVRDGTTPTPAGNEIAAAESRL